MKLCSYHGTTKAPAALISIILITILAFLPLVACGTQTPASLGSTAADVGSAETKTVTDMLGRTVEVPIQVNKVIGLGSSSLRVISYLEATDKVVGVEASEQEDNVVCTYRHVYHELFASLPVIGDGGSKGVTPNEEAIIQAAPELILASMDRDSADSLQQKTGIPVVGLTVGDTVFDQKFYDNVTLIGEVIGKQGRAQQIIQYMQDAQADLQKRTADIPVADVKTAYAAGISFRGGHGFAGTEAGFPPFQETRVTNIADVDGATGATGAFDIDLERIVSDQPDFIFIETSNLALVKDDYNNNPAYFANLDAVQAGNTFTLISYRFYATNVDLALANTYQVGTVVYPDSFAGIDPTKKLDEITEFFLGKALSADLAAQGCTFKQIDIAKL